MQDEWFDPGSTLVLGVAADPGAASVDVIAELLPVLSPLARLTAVHMLARIGTPDAVSLLLDTLERYVPDQVEYPGWGNPLWDLEVRPVHGDLLFPRLLRLRSTAPWITKLIDWVTVAYLLAGELTAARLVDVPGAGEALVRRTTSYRTTSYHKAKRVSPAWWEDPRHQEARREVLVVIEAMGVVGGPRVTAELGRLVASPDPQVAAAARSSLDRFSV